MISRILEIFTVTLRDAGFVQALLMGVVFTFVEIFN